MKLVTTKNGTQYFAKKVELIEIYGDNPDERGYVVEYDLYRPMGTGIWREGKKGSLFFLVFDIDSVQEMTLVEDLFVIDGKPYSLEGGSNV